MAKKFVEAFGFGLIAKRLQDVLNGYGFACSVDFLGSKAESNHDGRSIIVRSVPNSIVYDSLRWKHFFESREVFARLTPEQAILCLGYIDGTVTETESQNDFDTSNVGMNVQFLAYYLHKCSNVTVTSSD